MYRLDSCILRVGIPADGRQLFSKASRPIPGPIQRPVLSGSAVFPGVEMAGAGS